MRTINWSRHKYAALLSAVGFPLLYLLLYLAQGGRGGLGQTLQYFLQIGPHLFAACCNLVYACLGRHSSVARQRGWLLIGLACLAYSVGDVIYFYYVGMRGMEAPFPGWDDAAWLLVFPLLIGGVLALFGSMPQAGRMRLLLDSAIANSSLAALGWYFLVENIWKQSGTSHLGKFVSVACPLGDFAAVFGAIVLFNSPSTNRHLRRSLLFLACGIVAWAFADVVYAFSRLHSAFHDGSWTDLGWPLGSVSVGIAALSPFCKAEDLSIEGSKASKSYTFMVVPRLVSMFMPYVASLGAFLVISVHDYSRGNKQISNETLSIGLFMLLLVLLRQVFTLLENRHLTRQLVTFNETLEHRVARRTEQLSALLRINTAVNNTLNVEEVLTLAGEQAQEAFQADAVVVWLFETGEEEPENGQENAHAALLPVGKSAILPEMLAYLEQLPLLAHTEAVALPMLMAADSSASATTTNAPDDRAASAADEKVAGGYCLRAPLLWQHRLRGMIGILRWQSGFEPAEAELLQNIGLAVATALENARLYATAVAAADCDPVTGLFNHRAMHQRLDKALVQARDHNQAVAVMMVDLNNFKLFNDTYGHPVGDQVLRRVAETMRAECPPTASLGRYGGDEFIVVMPNMTTETAVQIAERMSAHLMAEGFRRGSDERVIPITLSFGLASFPDDSGNRHELLTIADKNLYTAKLSGDSIGRSTEFQRTNREFRAEASYGVLDSMVSAVDNKDRYTRQHSEDVTEYALWIAEEMGLSEETLRALRIGGLLHDVGKIGVPDEILRKPGRLTNEEYEILKQHPLLGALIVGSLPGMKNVVEVVRSHHERWDGKGYPDGLQGEAIPLLGRIAAVADAVSAMTTHRPYRRGMDWEVAFAEVRANAGTQFDPEIAAAFLRAARKQRLPASPVPEEATNELSKAA